MKDVLAWCAGWQSRTLRGWMAVALVMLCSLAGPVRAAEEPAAKLTRVEFGFGDTNNLQQERWGPLRITIDAVKRPFSGTLVISYPQDPTQGATVRVPAAGTPGVATPVEALVCLRANASQVSVTLLDERGRPVDRLRFGNVAEDPNAAPLIFDAREGMVLCLGRVSPDRVLVPLDLPPARQEYVVHSQPQQWSQQRLDDNRAYRLGSLRSVTVDPLTLPTQWAAYDTSEAVVVRTEELTSRMASASREAMMRWVLGGGRVVLVVDQPGDLWKLWLPGQLADLITIGEPSRVAVPKFLADVITTPDRAAARALKAMEDAARANNQGVESDEDGDPVGDGEVEAAPEVPKDVDGPKREDAFDQRLGGPLSTTEKAKIYGSSFPAAETLPGRPISLHTSLKHGGWRKEAGDGHPAILAHGPVGLGYVTILTADPALAATEPGPEPTRRAWLAVLTFGLEDWASLPVQPEVTRQAWWGGWNGATSGSDDLQRQALMQQLNLIADRPGRTLNPTAVLVAILACAFLLAVLLGPVDGIVLSLKRKMHWSWATALGWIVLISIVAGFVPWLVRGDLPTMRMSRSIESAVIDQSGATAWKSAVHGMFAAQPGERDLIVDQKSLPSGSVFRGVGVGNGWDSRETLFSALNLVQGTTLSQRGSEVSVWPMKVAQGQWSLRNMFSYGPVSAEEDSEAIRARVIRVGVRELRVECEGLPQQGESGFKIVSLNLWHSRHRDMYALAFGEAGATAPVQTSNLGVTRDVPEFAEPGMRSSLRMQAFEPAKNHEIRRTFGSMYDLPGAQRHDLAIAARLATGRWALVEAVVESEKLDQVEGEQALRTHARTVRLLVPIEGSATPPEENGVKP